MQAEQGRVLPIIAREAIAKALCALQMSTVDENASWLAEPGASFVTLMQHGGLRGCIGTLQAYQPLLADIKGNAVRAALSDPRFPPLAREDLATVTIEVSLLSATCPIDYVDEQDAMAQLRPGIDGIVFEYGRYRSTFLPQVWETLRQPEQFFTGLKQKAGLPKEFWDDGVKLSRYTVSKWREAEEIN